MVRDATPRNLEIIGEASKSLSPAFRASHPEVPWADMAGMRDVLIHRYSAVDLTRFARCSRKPKTHRDALETSITHAAMLPRAEVVPAIGHRHSRRGLSRMA